MLRLVSVCGGFACTGNVWPTSDLNTSFGDSGSLRVIILIGQKSNSLGFCFDCISSNISRPGTSSFLMPSSLFPSRPSALVISLFNRSDEISSTNNNGGATPSSMKINDVVCIVLPLSIAQICVPLMDV